MEQKLYSRESTSNASTEWPGASNRALRRALKRSIWGLREMELEEFSKSSRSPLAIRLSTLRGELCRVQNGLPVRIDTLTRILCGMRSFDVPVRNQPSAPVEVMQC